MRAWVALVSLAALACSACVTTRARTQAVIEIDAEDRVRAEASGLFVTVRGGPDLEALTGTFSDVVEDPSFPVRLTVLPRDDDPTRAWELIVVAATSDGTVVGRQRTRARFLAGTTTYVRLSFEDCCFDIAAGCANDQTCSSCACTATTTVDPTQDAGVPPIDAAPTIDAPGLDAPVGDDAGGDAGSIGCASPLACPARPCEQASCNRGVCEYLPLCAAGELCCNGECASNCDCMGRAAGEICRDADGVCDANETCDGVSGACPPDVAAPVGSLECRAATGLCDRAESCDGVSRECPIDAFVEAGTTCGGSATCNGLGTCTTTCVEGAECATSNPCAIGRMVCSPSPVCVDATPRPPGTVCRPSVGPCDVAETCEGTSCPGNGFVGAGTVCRPVDGSCDVEDACTGASADCSMDAVRSSGTTCRAATGICDASESCDGSTPACPADGFAPTTVECRAPITVCALPAMCPGTSATCPPNPPNADFTECGPCGSTCLAGLCRRGCSTSRFCCESLGTCVRSSDECNQ